ncbi:MAG TPA: MlaD family protein, partial [Micavibrio sp.]
SVSGLKEGASVQYKGLDVGKVIDMRLSPERKDLIKVDIEVDRATPVRSGTTATLALQGITGLLYMELTTQPGDDHPPEKIDGEAYPVLQGSGTQISKIFQEIPEIAQQVLDITGKINDFLDDENMASLEETLSNIQRMSHDLNGLLSEENIANATSAIENISRSSEDFKDISARFDKTAKEIDSAVADFRSVITDNKGNINKFTTEGLDQITATSRELERMVGSIRKMANELQKDPSRILYQPSSNGVEIPK